ncbi:WD40-repeat-containing domain protein [Elsinoe ampelina]|uniref:WD40-repeat-containing domain protein n=1 Tax=Elsinoe ampelina TaxID=302913 RepID=A0A6A6G7Q4_9PEZI|nr:WD40-repeat-containing domain protein [Elsinoe ampelina]
MAFKADVRTTFEPRHVISPIYTGGSVALSQDGRVLATCLGEEVLLSDLNTGEHLARIEGDGDIVTTLALAPDASYLAVCSRTLLMRIFSLSPSDTEDGKLDVQLVRSLKPHTAPVVVSAVDPTGTLLATGGADGVVKVWDIRRGFTTHTLHGHSGVVSALHFFRVAVDQTAARSNSRKRKSRKDEDVEMLDESSVATAGFRLASGGEDGKVRIWDLHKRKSIVILDSHVSVVRSLNYSESKQLLLSASRDQTVIAWDAATWQQAATIPVLETVEVAAFIDDGDYFFTAGESARLRIWNANGEEVTIEQEAGVETEAILDVLHHPGLPFLLSVHADQTLLIRSTQPLSKSRDADTLEPLPIIRRISGTHDEVIDLAWIGLDNSMMALATNSEDLRLINMGSGIDSQPFGADAALLKGHEDIIITIDTDWSGHWLATGAKDNTARLWRLDPDNDEFECYEIFTGHAESISAVALPNAVPAQGSPARTSPLSYPPSFLITGSQDKTVKKWDIATGQRKGSKTTKAAYTRKAHDKEMNAIDVAHSSTMFASASQDRTVKIWDVESGESIGVLRGHKRGVWTIAFAPPSIPTISGESGTSSGNRGMVVTGSGDKTVRIWSLNDFSCLRTFEGHTNSVLKVVWLPHDKDTTKKRHNRGPQVASAAGDGLVKVWDAQGGECDATLDNHIDRVWALAVKPTDREPKYGKATNGNADGKDDDGDDSAVEIVSGSADSTITFWKDTTAETAKVSATRATARIEQDQELQNYIHDQNYREAIVLALQLNHPKRLLQLFTTVNDSPTRDDESLTGSKGVDEVLGSLSDEQLWRLLLRIRDWNSNSRTARVAQRIMHALFRLYPKDKFVQLRKKRQPRSDLAGNLADLSLDGDTKPAGKSESIKDVLDGLKAYTDKHYARLEKMAEERYVLMWTLQMMDETSAVNGV